MKNDARLKNDVIEELQWEPSINSAKIGVAVSNGIVTLSGTVGSYYEKHTAEKVAKSIKGVRAVIEDIEVNLANSLKKSDLDIAEAALNNLEWDITVPHEKIMLKVEDGWITLEGEVNWHYQREAAKNAVKNLTGVKGVTNLVTVKTLVLSRDIKEKIKKSFERNAILDAGKVEVLVNGNKVTLKGTVQSLAEKKQAESSAWAAPGVFKVENKIEVGIPEYAL